VCFFFFFFGVRGEEDELGELSCPQRAWVCVCVCEREREREVSLCNEIFESPFLDFMTDLRKGVSLQDTLVLPPHRRVMFDLPNFSWGSVPQKGALLSAAHEHVDVCQLKTPSGNIEDLPRRTF